MTRLAVVDGDNLACRLYHGVRDRPPADAFGFALGRFIKQLQPTHMVVVFDPLDSTSSWRRDILPAYKADRQPRTPSLATMLADARTECRAARISVAETPDDYEADDVVGSYVRAASSEHWSTTIISADKDLTQLVSDDPLVTMLDEVRGFPWTPSVVEARLLVRPALVPDLLALIGDTSDGYPGVPGVGQKTAQRLLAEHGDLDGVIAWAHAQNEYKPTASKLVRLLVEHEQAARACLAVAQLRDVALPVPLHKTFLL